MPYTSIALAIGIGNCNFSFELSQTSCVVFESVEGAVISNDHSK